MSETKNKENSDSAPITNFDIDGYTFHYTPAKNNFGGVGLYIKNNHTVKSRVDLIHSVSTIFESIFIELESSDGKNIIIGSSYRHHTPIASFISHFSEKVLHKLSKDKNKKCALLGDFNIDLLQTDSHDISCDFYDIISAFGFRPLILQPSRVQTTRRGTSATLIDNIFITDCSNFSNGGNITASISDHFPQFCSIANILFLLFWKMNIPGLAEILNILTTENFRRNLVKLTGMITFVEKIPTIVLVPS